MQKERNKKLRRQQDAPCINQGKGDTLARSAVCLLHQWIRQLVGIWRMAGSPLLQTKDLRAFCYYKCASCSSQSLSKMHRVSMQFKGSLVDPLRIEAELFETMQSVGGIDWISYTKKDGVEYNLFGSVLKTLFKRSATIMLYERWGLLEWSFGYSVGLPESISFASIQES